MFIHTVEYQIVGLGNYPRRIFAQLRIFEVNLQKYKKPIFGTKSILDHYYSHSGVRISVNITQFICKKFAHLPILEVKFANI